MLLFSAGAIVGFALACGALVLFVAIIQPPAEGEPGNYGIKFGDGDKGNHV